ncbi:hypothetical protein VTI74DRAFT_7772 [Chaetomium olivicolor]
MDTATNANHITMFSAIILASLLGFSPFAAATLSLKPWEISHLGTFSPSGRPGSSPYSVINITISDPNDASVSPATCVGKWTFEEPPYGKINDCSDVPGGQWTFVMLESDGQNPSPTTDFKLRFDLKKKKKVRFVGVEKFVVGENLSGLCSASGVCSFGLKEEKTPFPVQQARVH